MNDHYQNSLCQPSIGLLHDWQLYGNYKGGIVERCTWCKEKLYSPEGVPNDVYISTHLKSALQQTDPLFRVNYPNFVGV